VAALADPDDTVRQTAVQLLGASPTFLPDLQRAVVSGSFSSVARAGAVAAAGRISTPEALRLVLAGADDKDPRVRVAAIRALGNFTDLQATQLAEGCRATRTPRLAWQLPMH
jgi:HEAT repeat protein